jgi:hypothetical protein
VHPAGSASAHGEFRSLELAVLRRRLDVAQCLWMKVLKIYVTTESNYYSGLIERSSYTSRTRAFPFCLSNRTKLTARHRTNAGHLEHRRSGASIDHYVLPNDEVSKVGTENRCDFAEILGLS